MEESVFGLNFCSAVKFIDFREIDKYVLYLLDSSIQTQHPPPSPRKLKFRQILALWVFDFRTPSPQKLKFRQILVISEIAEATIVSKIWIFLDNNINYQFCFNSLQTMAVNTNWPSNSTNSLTGCCYFPLQSNPSDETRFKIK